MSCDLFISYASRDADRVVPIAKHLESTGVTVWRDQDRILGGGSYGPEIVEGIEQCKVLMLMCSAASMRSRNVKQEIQLAWHYERPYLPLLLDDSIGRAYPKQVQYWLEGCQWIEVLDRPPEAWGPAVLRALERLGAADEAVGSGEPEGPPGARPIRLEQGMAGLRKLASFTDQIWPIPAEAARRGVTRGTTRGLGAPQPDVKHGHRLGSRVRLVIESEREGHLLLLDEGPEGVTYCLCPSRFAPDTRLCAGKSVLPQPQSEYDSFLVTGVPGREHLLAIVTDQPLDLRWMLEDCHTPASVLNRKDIDTLLVRLRGLEGGCWAAYSTFFEVSG